MHLRFLLCSSTDKSTATNADTDSTRRDDSNNSSSNKAKPACVEHPHLLAWTNPCPTAVHMEPFSTSVVKGSALGETTAETTAAAALAAAEAIAVAIALATAEVAVAAMMIMMMMIMVW